MVSIMMEDLTEKDADILSEMGLHLLPHKKKYKNTDFHKKTHWFKIRS